MSGPGTAANLRILLVKPYQSIVAPVCQPPLGLLYLAAMVQRELPDARIEIADLRLAQHTPDDFLATKIIQDYDLVGVSALNFETDVAHRIAHGVKRLSPKTITALGGPYAHSSRQRALELGGFDWIFDGEADYSFIQAIRARFLGQGDLGSVVGLTWRADREDIYYANGGQDSIVDLDALPFPAWALVDFDAYARMPNQNGWLKGRRYAPLFTSRGCPYKCSYCHDLFGKKFHWRSAENVLAEVDLLVQQFDIDEFQIVDDIFNLHKPRMRKIAHGVIDRYGEKQLHFCLPNGVRADILEKQDIELLARMGLFQVAIAIETVTERLQSLVDKHLNIERAKQVIQECDDAGILTKGFFMIGFPTESLAEIRQTIDYAVASRLTWAGFYSVIPQEGTKLHQLAEAEAPDALDKVILYDYYNDRPWYDYAYGVDLGKIQKRAFRRFYLKPWRIARIIRTVGAQSLAKGFLIFLRIIAVLDPILGEARKYQKRDTETLVRKAVTVIEPRQETMAKSG